MAADKIVPLNRRRGGPDSELVQSSATGEARLKELERLIQTAAEVQAQAEAELSQTTASQSVAQQRKAAADSVRRKAEAEMAKLRTELARQAERTKQVWSPGDPISEPRSDFEVSTLTGTARRGRFSDSAFMDSELELDDDSSKMSSRISSAGGTSKTGSSKTSHSQYRTASHQKNSKKRSKSGWAVALLLILGISAGAGFTWFSLQNPDAVGNQLSAIKDRVSSLSPASVENHSSGPKAVVREVATETAKPVNTSVKTAAISQQRTSTQAAWQQAVKQQELRVRDAAALRFKQRTQL